MARWSGNVPFMNARGAPYKYQGRFSEAARLYRRALNLLTTAHRRAIPMWPRSTTTWWLNMPEVAMRKASRLRVNCFAPKTGTRRKPSYGAADQAAQPLLSNGEIQ
jgi:hypothetical protein